MDSAAIDSHEVHLERFAIVHLSLKEIATGSGLDEGASNEELAESILYYFHARSRTLAVENTKDARISSAAVRMAGLAAALWSFPASLTASESSTLSDSYQFVKMTNFNLLLVLLEKNILAVVQLSKKALVTPQAMAANIQRQYCLYDLFGDASVQESCQHSGMKELYTLYKERRKEVGKSGSEGAAAMNSVQEKIDRIQCALPITALRSELREYFDMFCAEWESIRQVFPACARSIVQCTPCMLPGSLPLSRRTVSTMNTTDWSTKLGEILEANEALLGVSVFVDGLFEDTATSTESDFTINNKTACLIMHYLSSVRQRFPNEHEPAAAGFLRRTLGGFLQGDPEDDKGAFLKPPPLSMLSTSVQEVPFCSLENEDVWTPRVTFRERTKTIHACLFFRSNHAFVIYLNAVKKNDFPNALLNFGAFIDNESFPKPTWLAEARERTGQTVIWIDRPRQRTILGGSSGTPKTMQTTLNVDERYELASSLSLDTLLALDDAMQHAIHHSTERYESCTLLKHNWLVCRAQNGQELYAVLDVKHFVTIQDVSVAMKEIEQQFSLSR